MEVVEEPPVQGIGDCVKGSSMNVEEAELLAETSLCPTSNGVTESVTPLESSGTVYSVATSITADADIPDENVSEPQGGMSHVMDVASTAESLASATPSAEEMLVEMETDVPVEGLVVDQEISEEIVESADAILGNEVAANPVDSVEVDSSNDKVQFTTEILVEKNDEVMATHEIVVNTSDHSNANILNDLEQGLELSEALRSSDTTDNVENNNIPEGEEVFNKEELLDILEGNDEMQEENWENLDETKTKKILEAQIALKQLSRLKKQHKKRTSTDASKKIGRPRQKKRAATEGNGLDNANSTQDSGILEESVAEEEEEVPKVNSNVDKKDNDNNSIVNVLVKDWDDDEPVDANELSELNKSSTESQVPLKPTDSPVKSRESTANKGETPIRKSIDNTAEINPNKSGDEGQPQRRLGRVIKKKVIFDPDNPDTFTKGKIVAKSKESTEEKEQPPPKKIKPEHSPQRPKSKSPTGKLQWKKPTPKSSCKQNRRLTEVDKLLMDEGAVNMIYQLTPEAPKGKKNMRTKAEFIKKIQSSTPDGKEMKFRERKKECKVEEGEAKKILGGKMRSSLTGSLKSASVTEDFETHSADDSIIYRRHSSSSYSSTCMSPRRLSDVETGAAQAGAALAAAEHNTTKESDVFMADVSNASSEMINLNDCLSLKQKLNSKLSQALNKKKKESVKSQKPPKQKRISKNSSVDTPVVLKTENIADMQYVSVKINQRLAEIYVKKTENSIQVLKELNEALLLIDGKPEVSVTLLTSECGTLCSDIAIQPLLAEVMEDRINYAHEIAEAVRCVSMTLEKHSKVVVVGVWGTCGSVAAALVALSDVALGGEQASFGVTAPPQPGLAALTARCCRLSPALVSELVVLGRRVSAAEALRGGLLSRVVPLAAAHQARALAADIAQDPAQQVLLRKQLMNLKKTKESEATFLSGLERERDLLVEYWTSMEGQEALRASLNT